MRAAFRTVLVSALAIALLAIFLRNADLSRVWSELTSARTDLVLLAVVLTFAMAFVRAERWQYLLAPLGPTRFWTAFRTTIIGFAVSFILPARAGEVLRPYLLAKREQLPATAAFATIIVERLLDLLTVVILLVMFFVFLQSGEAAAAPALYRAVVLGAAMVAPVSFAVLIAMFVMAGHPERVHALGLTVERVLPNRIARAIAGFMRTFAQGLAVVRSPIRLLWAMVWSLVLWVAIATQLWVIVRAFDISLPVGGALLVTAILVVGVAVPTPGGVGGTHEALRLSLTAFYGADNDAAVGAAILQHGVNFVPYLLLGFLFLAQEGLNMTKLRALSASAREDAAESRREGSAAAESSPSAVQAHDEAKWPAAEKR